MSRGRAAPPGKSDGALDLRAEATKYGFLYNTDRSVKRRSVERKFASPWDEKERHLPRIGATGGRCDRQRA